MLEVTPQTVITAGAAITAALLLAGRFAGGVRWFDRQKQQSVELESLKRKHEADLAVLKQMLAKDMQDINREQQLLTCGVLACLKGLREKGCNGPVTEAIDKIERYLNEKAHES